MIRIIAALVLFFSVGAHAAGFSGATAATGGKSAKKIEADRNRTAVRSPEVIEQGDNSIGARAFQGDAFDSHPLLGVNFEHMITDNFGVGGAYGYSTYQTTVHAGGFKGTYTYDVHVFAALGSYHFNVFQVKNLDTYVSAGLGRTVLRSEWSSNTGLADQNSADSSSTYLLGYVTARYFINSRLGFTGSLGTPIGTLAVGMDYLF